LIYQLQELPELTNIFPVIPYLSGLGVTIRMPKVGAGKESSCEG